jgi:transcriptional regulator NrdR family protein
MEALRHLDSVAYVRYASVYQEFDCLGDFAHVIAPNVISQESALV